MSFVRLRTGTNAGKVHRADVDGTPRCNARRGKKCETQGGEVRGWIEVDETKYPRSHWKRCRNEECFGGVDE